MDMLIFLGEARGEVSLTIQYKAVTRVDVTPAILVHPSAFHERDKGGKDR